MKENSWGNWSYDLKMDDKVTESLCDTNNTFEEEFLSDIFHQTPQDLYTVPIANNVSHSTQHVAEKPSSYILSFDNSTILLPPTQQHNHPMKDSLPLSSSKANQRSNSRKRRSASESLDHIMSERKRRKEIALKFIELSALLPGLEKTDKAYVLREAINYVQQLKERVKELEENIKKKDVESVIKMTRSHLFIDNDTAIAEINTEESNERKESLPEVEARVVGKEVLIRIHCEVQKGIVVNIMSQLQLHHLSITTTSIMPFRNTLNINIVAQMGEKCNLIVKDLVEKLRVATTLQACDDVRQ